MSKSKISYKMCYVTLSAFPEFRLKERKAKVYVDLDTGKTYGSEKVVSRIHHRDDFVRSNAETAISLQISTQFTLKNIPKVVGAIKRDTDKNSLSTDYLNQGKGMPLKFVSFD